MVKSSAQTVESIYVESENVYFGVSKQTLCFSKSGCSIWPGSVIIMTGQNMTILLLKTHTRQPETELCVMTGIIEQMESEENWRMAAQVDLNKEEI